MPPRPATADRLPSAPMSVRFTGPIALIGLMGSGKSTVGRPLATALGRTFVDSDDEIEARTGRSVRELWEAGGEQAYRPLEAEITLDALGRPDVVYGVPGGAVLEAAVQEALRRSDVFVAWLDAPPALLAHRSRSNHDRPLLADDPELVLATQLADRGPLLTELATVHLDATLPPEDLVAAILRAFDD
jgi:shikimate kinase